MGTKKETEDGWWGIGVVEDAGRRAGHGMVVEYGNGWFMLGIESIKTCVWAIGRRRRAHYVRNSQHDRGIRSVLDIVHGIARRCESSDLAAWRKI